MNNSRISINSISKIVWKNICLILISTIIFGLAGALYAKHKKHTDYEAVRSIMINHAYHGAAANEEVQADISLGRTYSKIVESQDVANSARHNLSKKLKRKYSSNQISSMVNASPVDQTTIIKIGVKSDSAKDSTALVNAVTKASAKQIPTKVPYAGKISLFAKAKQSEAQSRTFPSIKKFAVLGAAVGFLIGMIIAFSITTWIHII